MASNDINDAVDSKNLYRFFYGENGSDDNKGRYGYVFGKPLRFTSITDPNDEFINKQC